MVCNPTKQPPRHDLYAILTELTADKGGSFLPKPRLGSLDWVNSGPDKPAIFNAAYDIDGTPLDVGEDPWTVIDLDGDWRHFPTHAEALAYAFKETA